MNWVAKRLSKFAWWGRVPSPDNEDSWLVRRYKESAKQQIGHIDNESRK